MLTQIKLPDVIGKTIDLIDYNTAEDSLLIRFTDRTFLYLIADISWSDPVLYHNEDFDVRLTSSGFTQIVEFFGQEAIDEARKKDKEEKELTAALAKEERRKTYEKLRQEFENTEENNE